MKSRIELIKPATVAPIGEAREVQPVKQKAIWIRTPPFPLSRLTGGPQKKNGIIVSFLTVVLIPTAAYFLYLFLFASPQYESEFRALVRSSNQTKSFDLSQMFTSTGLGKSADDPYAIIQYLQSQQAVLDLSKAFPLTEKFSSSGIDYFSRMKSSPLLEETVRYWNKRLNAYYENTTGTVVVKITAFSANDAHDIAARVLSASEQLVNKMSERSREDLVSYSKKAVTEAEARLQELGDKMFALRNRDGVLDPQKYANVNIEQIGKIQEDIIEARAKMSVQAQYLSADSPNMRLESKRLEALESELRKAQGKITSTEPQAEGVLSNTIRDFERLQAEKDFAQKAYQAALASLQSAQSDAARQKMYLDTIVAPTSPQEPIYPWPLINTATFGAILGLAWVLALILGASIRDHL